MACDHFYKSFVSSHVVTERKTNLALRRWLQWDTPLATEEAGKFILGGRFY